MKSEVKTEFKIGAFIKNLHVEKAQSYRNLTIYPVIGGKGDYADYWLLDEAIKSGDFFVEEMNEAGVVERLRFRNKSARRVLIFEGEQVVGLKQNRIVNITIISEPGAEIHVPVNCVEAGRWAWKRTDRPSSASVSSPSLRSVMNRELTASLKRLNIYQSDQGKIWSKIHDFEKKAKRFSDTSSYHDLESSRENEVEEYIRHFEIMDSQIGMFAAVNGEIILFETVSNSDIARRIMPRLFRSCTMDALDMMDEKPDSHSFSTPEEFLKSLKHLKWEPFSTYGSGQQYRTENKHISASALICDGQMIHLTAYHGN